VRARTLLLLAAALLGACSSLLTSRAAPEQTYYLRAPAVAGGGEALGASLRVGHPQTDPGLDSPRITLRQPDHRMSFYTGARWPGPVPDLIESLAVQTLRAGGGWSSVEDSTSPFPSDYLLQTTVRRFDADYSAAGAAPEVHVALDCILGRREGRDVVASFTAEGSATAGANRQGAVVEAFEQALGNALQQLAQRSLEAGRADAPHREQEGPQNGVTPAPSSSRPTQ